jgi:hypothetical protein
MQDLFSDLLEERLFYLPALGLEKCRMGGTGNHMEPKHGTNPHRQAKAER